jgi:hypothetical protein
MRPSQASEAISPMVPWPHMFRKPALLKKITPAVACGETGWQQRADQHVVAAWLKNDGFDASRRSRGRSGRGARHAAVPRSGKPSTTRRVGSPPVWESITLSSGRALSWISGKLTFCC